LRLDLATKCAACGGTWLVGRRAIKPRHAPPVGSGYWLGRNRLVVGFSLVRDLGGRHAQFRIFVPHHNIWCLVLRGRKRIRHPEWLTGVVSAYAVP
jgi:hypothetical protein